MNSTKTTIILVTWNGLSNIKLTIETLFKSKSEYQLIIVDNGSDNYTLEYLEELKAGKDIKVIFNKENLGVVKARLQALEFVKTPYVYFSDSDVYFPSFDWLSILEEYFENDPKVGIVGPLKTSNKVSHPYLTANLKAVWEHIVLRPISIEEKISKFTDKRTFEEFHKDLCLANQHLEKSIKIPPRAISACALLTKTEIAQNSQYVDHEYIKGLWGMEDVDFSWEVNKAGYKVLKATNLYIHHFGHVSINHSETNLDHKTEFYNLRYFFTKWSQEVLSWLEESVNNGTNLQEEELYRVLKKLPTDMRPPEINVFLKNEIIE